MLHAGTKILPRLFLIRRGDTDWTDSHQHTGRTDLPLNARGEDHARILGGRLKGKTFARVFVSPLQRVRRTCELAGFAEHAAVAADLTEWNYGDYESQTTDDVHRQRPQWNLYRPVVADQSAQFPGIGRQAGEIVAAELFGLAGQFAG